MLIKDVYINGVSAISAQPTFDESFVQGTVLEQTGAYRKAIDPEYKEYLNPTASRRFSRLIKMSLVSAQKSLKMAGIEMPEAIITGTGLGCLEDTEKFLSALIESEETLLSPTAFIQSTHNTISGQIAMMIKCNYPNYTYSNRYFSFESSLLDAVLMMNDKSSETVMVHAADEIIPNVHTILTRMKLWNRGEQIKVGSSQKAVTSGEGVVNLILSATKTAASFARVKGLKLQYILLEQTSIEQMTTAFLKECGVDASEVDLVITGMNGEPDDMYYTAVTSVVPDASVAAYKHLFGESFTASAFAYWLGTQAIKTGCMPETCLVKGTLPSNIQNILVYNQFRGKYHSLCLLSDVEV